jgi:hypothetical protein
VDVRAYACDVRAGYVLRLKVRLHLFACDVVSVVEVVIFMQASLTCKTLIARTKQMKYS